MANFKASTLQNERTVFQLLQNGPINLYYKTAILDDTIQYLEFQKYVVHEFDCRNYQAADAVLWDVGLRLGFPYGDIYKPGLDGFSDFLSDVRVPDESGLFLAFRHFHSYYREFSTYAHQVLDIFASNYLQNLLFGYRFSVLIQTDDPLIQIEPVGAFPANWNSKESLIKSRSL